MRTNQEQQSGDSQQNGKSLDLGCRKKLQSGGLF
jgi:hypothetical protein